MTSGMLIVACKNYFFYSAKVKLAMLISRTVEGEVFLAAHSLLLDFESMKTKPIQARNRLWGILIKRHIPYVCTLAGFLKVLEKSVSCI